jgi:septum formation protein
MIEFPAEDWWPALCWPFVCVLILASQSPRRLELLRLIGWDFEVMPVQVDETPWPDEPPADYVMRLAGAKARAVHSSAPLGSVVVGADTSVVDRGEILGKPADPGSAVEMLQRLRGHSHQVYSAVAVLHTVDGALLLDLCITDVPMRQYGDDEIQRYVESGDPLDKAGSYAIQHQGFRPVERLDGCAANVMGLPLCHLTRTLRRIGLAPAADVPARCQEMLSYHCPVFKQILNEN